MEKNTCDDTERSTPGIGEDNVLAAVANGDTASLERKLLAKVDFRVLPTITVIYVLAFLDRVNIGNALLFHLPADLHLQAWQSSVALCVFFVAYVLFEIPANLLLKKLKPHVFQLKRDIEFAAERSAVYHNRKRDRGPTLEEGDKVYLLQRNIKTTRPSKKLDYTKIGLFPISKKKGLVNYQLDLPEGMKKHPVFHVSLLEPADADTPLQTNPSLIDPENQDGEFKVEDILDQQDIDGQPHFLVKWKDYEHSENTWELERNLTHCAAKLHRFRQRNPQQATYQPQRH
ncbi:reverse transcriptase domain protein [Lasallia pustulata]|uniref:Reverse transcriptase domain protein n=1 Tax=Lasallia pustulata TaxID=136370 RepID=A0A1W5CTT5_9LECA|nr:reverse transcriptase domain protein [Lasallia pustulata]